MYWKISLRKKWVILVENKSDLVRTRVVSIVGKKQRAYFRNHLYIMQGPLYKWTDHSQNFEFWNYKVGGAPISPRGWMGVGFLDHTFLKS